MFTLSPMLALRSSCAPPPTYTSSSIPRLPRLLTCCWAIVLEIFHFHHLQEARSAQNSPDSAPSFSLSPHFSCAFLPWLTFAVFTLDASFTHIHMAPPTPASWSCSCPTCKWGNYSKKKVYSIWRYNIDKTLFKLGLSSKFTIFRLVQLTFKKKTWALKRLIFHLSLRMDYAPFWRITYAEIVCQRKLLWGNQGKVVQKQT